MRRFIRRTLKSSRIFSWIYFFFYVKKPIDAKEFIENWEIQYESHDPSPDEILENLRCLKLRSVLDIGGGYGRIATHLQTNGIEVVLVEPNPLLALKAKGAGIVTHEKNATDLRNLEVGVFDCAIVVRVVAYLGFFEIIRMLRQISLYTNILIAYEESIGSARLRLARICVPSLKVKIKECVN